MDSEVRKVFVSELQRQAHFALIAFAASSTEFELGRSRARRAYT
jgi:hypothetical protein